MAKIYARESGTLFFDFTYLGVRCREYTSLQDSQKNRKLLQPTLSRISASIELNQFNYADFFPNSKKVEQFRIKETIQQNNNGYPLFDDFCNQWFEEMSVTWRNSYKKGVRQLLDSRLIPEFGNMSVSNIPKADILNFRSKLAKVSTGNNKTMSATHVNRHIKLISMILREAADRFNFNLSFKIIKGLKVPRTDIYPFTVEEMNLFFENIREDYLNYFKVRFLTGMRTSEIDGLMWKYIDFDRREILIREALVGGHMDYVKNDSSYRAIQMSQPVFDALIKQKESTHKFDYVFCNANGNPLSYNNVSNRVWYPLLRYLSIKKRNPYQTRHTAATLWLASGEAPEWIARQMGHANTEMLFSVYSRYVPNLTRQDGSAFEQLLKQTQIN